VKKHAPAASRSRISRVRGSLGRRGRAGPAAPRAAPGPRGSTARPARSAPERAGADPDELAARAQLIEPGGRVGADRRGSTSRSHTSAAAPSPCSGTSTSRRRSTRRRRRDGGRRPARRGRKRASARWSAGSISLRSAASEARRSRRSTSGSHHSRSSRRGAARRGRARRRARARAARRRAVDAVARAHLVGGERAVGGGVARDEQREQRVGHVLEERLGQPAGRHHPERVAVEAGVGGVDPALLAGEADRSRGARAPARRASPIGVDAGSTRAADLRRGQVADARSTSCSPSRWRRVARRAAGRPRRARARRVDQVAQLLLAEQLAQQVAVERQRGGAALGVGRVALVHVGGDVVEQQRGGERRGGRRLDLDERDLAAVELAQQLDQAGQVEHVAQALAVGLEHDREVAVARDLEQRLGLQPLLPQRRALARGRRAGSAARGRRSRGSARRTAPSRRARPTTRSSTSSGSISTSSAAEGSASARRRRAGGG
jgi:hypothetical protein